MKRIARIKALLSHLYNTEVLSEVKGYDSIAFTLNNKIVAQLLYMNDCDSNSFLKLV